MMQSRGRGAMKPLVKRPVVDRYCMSPQIAPPYFNAAQKAKFASEDDYHEGKKK